MPDPGKTSPSRDPAPRPRQPGPPLRAFAPGRDPAAAALGVLLDAATIDPAIDPAIVHRALVTALLRLAILRALGELPPTPIWPAFLARCHAFFAEHPTPLFAPDPLLESLALPDLALLGCLDPLARTSPGDIHQSLLSLRLERTGECLHLRPGPERRRRGGHYTAPAFARDLIVHALRPALTELGPDPSADAILALRICDPAMGCAAFLIAACDLLAGHLARARQSPDLAAARRDIALHCLHGVDLDPLAVELARLALWTHLGDRQLPLAALAPNLRHGDALVGLSPAQILAADWHPLTDLAVPHADPLTLALAGDALITAFFATPRPAERAKARLHLRPLLARLHQNDPAARAELTTFIATQRSRAPTIHPFHWPLEFPAIFTRPNPGFDLVLGNPPFFWGNRIGRAFGPAYRDWLQTLHPGAHGNSDLAAHFLRRGFALLRDGGGLGLVTTNSISEAETRLTGLDHLQQHGGVIHHANRDLPWPGDASVRIATVCVRRGPVPGPHTLDGRELPAIASDLRPGLTEPLPRRLAARRGQSFKGVDFGGTGFLLTPTAHAELLARAPAEAAFLWPVLNASQLVGRPPGAPTDHIINFTGHTLDDLGTRAPHCLDIVRRTVLPRRQIDHRRHRRERWWLYNEACPGLYRAIHGLPRVLVGPVVARHHVFAFVDPHAVFTNALNVFAFADAAALTLLQSRPHELWALRHASSLRCDPRYNPTTCFETYPFPPAWPALPELRAAGERYHQHRRDLMQHRGDGLTTTYNRFHDPDERAPDILELRRLHAELDHAVLTAHAWHDLLPHARAEFQPRPGDGPPRARLCWPDALAAEVYARLLAANLAALG